MTENENPNLSFDGLPRTVAELHAKIDRLTAMLERHLYTADTQPLPEIMTVEDVSAMLRKSVSTIYAMTSEHRIPYRKRGNKLYFMRTEIKSWLMDSVVPKDIPKRGRKPDAKREVMNLTDRNPKPEPDNLMKKAARRQMNLRQKTTPERNNKIRLTLSNIGRTRGTGRPFSPCHSRMKLKPPEKGNSLKQHVNFTVTGATSATAVTSSTPGRMPRFLQRR